MSRGSITGMGLTGAAAGLTDATSNSGGACARPPTALMRISALIWRRRVATYAPELAVFWGVKSTSGYSVGSEPFTAPLGVAAVVKLHPAVAAMVQLTSGKTFQQVQYPAIIGSIWSRSRSLLQSKSAAFRAAAIHPQDGSGNCRGTDSSALTIAALVYRQVTEALPQRRWTRLIRWPPHEPHFRIRVNYTNCAIGKPDENRR